MGGGGELAWHQSPHKCELVPAQTTELPTHTVHTHTAQERHWEVNAVSLSAHY